MAVGPASLLHLLLVVYTIGGADKLADELALLRAPLVRHTLVVS